MIMFKYCFIFLQVLCVLGQDAGVAEDKLTTSKILPTITTVPSTSEAKTTQPPQTTTTQLTTTTTSTPATVTPTTSAPTTTSSPKVDKWLVEVNGTVCIIASMDIKLDLKTEGQSKDTVVKVPKEAVANGNCGENVQILALKWENNNLTLRFKSNETLEKYHLDFVSLDLKEDNVSISLSQSNLIIFETALNHSYMCSYSDPLKLNKDNNTATFSFSNIKLVAFKKDNATTFSNVFACPPDTPDIVPIVVGCALTVLVVVVLIAYLVGRRRTQARGYLSM